jgi:hypothetical protein
MAVHRSPASEHLKVVSIACSIGLTELITHRHELCLQERVVHIVWREEHDHESDDDILVTLVECFRRGMPVN